MLLGQTAPEECWQVHKLLIAQQWEATTAFGTVWVMDRCNTKAWMTHPVQPPDTTLPSSISAGHPVRSQLDGEAVTGVTRYSAGDFS